MIDYAREGWMHDWGLYDFLYVVFYIMNAVLDNEVYFTDSPPLGYYKKHLPREFIIELQRILTLKAAVIKALSKFFASMSVAPVHGWDVCVIEGHP